MPNEKTLIRSFYGIETVEVRSTSIRTSTLIRPLRIWTVGAESHPNASGQSVE